MAATTRQFRSQRAPAATDYALHGWTDSAEWVEPIERSLAAVSASALADRATDLYRPGGAPPLTHILVVIDTANQDGQATTAHDHRVATMAHLRVHFPFVGAVASVGAARYAVLAHRHAGLARAVASLERRLQADPAVTSGGAAVWCEELPDSVHDVDACIRGLRIKRPSAYQTNRGELAAGLPVEVLAGFLQPGVPGIAERTERHRSAGGRWLGRSAALALFAALLMGGVGTAAAVGARLQPWNGLNPRTGPTERFHTAGEPGSGRAGQDMLSLLIPGFSPSLVEELLGLVGDADLAPSSPAPAPPAPGGRVPDPPAPGVSTNPGTPTPPSPDTAPLPLPNETPPAPAPPEPPAAPEIAPEGPPAPPALPELPPPPEPEAILEPVTDLLPEDPVLSRPELPL